MVLERQISLLRGAFKLTQVMHDDAVVDHGESGLAAFLSALEQDVIGLPFAGFAAGIHHGRVVAIEARGLAIGVGVVLI